MASVSSSQIHVSCQSSILVLTPSLTQTRKQCTVESIQVPQDVTKQKLKHVLTFSMYVCTSDAPSEIQLTCLTVRVLSLSHAIFGFDRYVLMHGVNVRHLISWGSAKKNAAAFIMQLCDAPCPNPITKQLLCHCSAAFLGRSRQFSSQWRAPCLLSCRNVL